MRAMIAVLRGISVGVMVAVVKLERNLRAVIEGRRADGRDIRFTVQIILIQCRLHIRLRHTGRIGCSSKDLMVEVNAGVQDGNNHALAVKTGGVRHTAADHAVTGCHIRLNFKRRCNKRRFHVVKLTNLLKLSVSNGCREAVCQSAVAVFNLHRFPRKNHL